MLTLGKTRRRTADRTGGNGLKSLASALLLKKAPRIAGYPDRRHHPTYPTGGLGLPRVLIHGFKGITRIHFTDLTALSILRLELFSLLQLAGALTPSSHHGESSEFAASRTLELDSV